MLKLLQNHPNNIQLLEIVGRVDDEHALSMTLDIANALARGQTQILLDLSGVQFMNSAGLRELVDAWKQVQRAGGRLILVNPSEQVRKLLDLVGLDSVLEIHNDPQWTPARIAPEGLLALSRQTRYCF